jgi:lipoate-protein ligase A
MFLILNTSHNPYFNIALEEYFFSKFQEPVTILYRNSPSVILGKHQIALKEINSRYVANHKIPVIRRISGGGAVYHDLGNINFTFIKNGESEKLSDFPKFTEPIIKLLNDLGVPAKLANKSDIVVNDIKISGNAEHTFKNRVLHHGTILFSSDLQNLSNSLRQDEIKFVDNSVKSRRANVMNLISFVEQHQSKLNSNSNFSKVLWNVEEFLTMLYMNFLIYFSDIQQYVLNEIDIMNINKLVDEKYKTFEWNYGYLGNYQFQNVVLKDDLHIQVHLNVANAVIKEIEIESNDKNLFEISKFIVGKKHLWQEIKKELITLEKQAKINKLQLAVLMDLLF